MAENSGGVAAGFSIFYFTFAVSEQAGAIHFSGCTIDTHDERCRMGRIREGIYILVASSGFIKMTLELVLGDQYSSACSLYNLLLKEIES